VTVRKTRSLYRALSMAAPGTRPSVVNDLQGLVLAIQAAYLVVPTAIGALIGVIAERGRGAAVGAAAGLVVGAAGLTAMALT